MIPERTCAIQVDLDSTRVLAGFLDPGRGASFDPASSRDASIEALGRFGEVLDAAGARATLFAVGCDLDDPGFAAGLKRLHGEGHEIANHTFSHPAGFADLPRAERAREILSCGEAIVRVTGVPVVGFRAPCYRVDRATLEILGEAGYLYDASVLPSPFVLAMKAITALCGRGGTLEERFVRGPGRLADAFAPRGIHRASSSPAGSPLVEVPMPVSRLARIPLHSTALLALPRAAPPGLGGPHADRFATLSFHLVDLVDPRQIPGFVRRRHPVAGLPLPTKMRRCRRLIRAMGRRYDLVPTRDLVMRWSDQGQGS